VGLGELEGGITGHAGVAKAKDRLAVALGGWVRVKDPNSSEVRLP
jgi:hypothetical protein